MQHVPPKLSSLPMNTAKHTHVWDIIVKSVTPTGPSAADLDYYAWGNCHPARPYTEEPHQSIAADVRSATVSQEARQELVRLENDAVFDGGWPVYLKQANEMRPNGEILHNAKTLDSSASSGSAPSLASLNSAVLNDGSGSGQAFGSVTFGFARSGSSGFFMYNWLWALLAVCCCCCLSTSSIAISTMRKTKQRTRSARESGSLNLEMPAPSKPTVEGSPLLDQIFTGFDTSWDQVQMEPSMQPEPPIAMLPPGSMYAPVQQQLVYPGVYSGTVV